ncbi:MAG: SRPBCC family protein [Acidimicrobiales bacterium]
MEIKNEFTVTVPIDQAWAVLTDLALVATCLPGAQLTGQEGETYLGKVKIKVGPVVSEYAGTAVFTSKDDANYRAVIEAKGRNSGGAGNATANITASLRADGANTIVSVDTDLSITGKIAQFGKSAIVEVSGILMGQFVASLEAKLTESQGAPDESPQTTEASAAPPPAEPEVLDVMSIARGAIYKRLIPVVVVIVVVVVVIVLLVR